MVGRAKWATKGSKGVNTWREKWRINRDKYWLSEYWRGRRKKMESNKGTGNFQKRRGERVEGIRRSKREVIYTD